VEILVLDEADRMLDMGFIHDMTKILQRLPVRRQTLLFSATISDDIRLLAAKFLHDPQTLRVGEGRNPATTVSQHFFHVTQEDKHDLLLHVIGQERMKSVLVFSRTKHGVDKIVRRLGKKGIVSAALHSNRTQSQRQRALEGFRQGHYSVLAATDIAARGIDVDGISHVINYDIPHSAEDYIHRVGRTGRAGEGGSALTFVGPADGEHLRRVEKFTGKRYEVTPYPGFMGRTGEGQNEAGSQQLLRRKKGGSRAMFKRKDVNRVSSRSGFEPGNSFLPSAKPPTRSAVRKDGGRARLQKG
jgi:ATP-dependent RNA helicase RhlE